MWHVLLNLVKSMIAPTLSDKELEILGNYLPKHKITYLLETFSIEEIKPIFHKDGYIDTGVFYPNDLARDGVVGFVGCCSASTLQLSYLRTERTLRKVLLHQLIIGKSHVFATTSETQQKSWGPILERNGFKNLGTQTGSHGTLVGAFVCDFKSFKNKELA